MNCRPRNDQSRELRTTMMKGTRATPSLAKLTERMNQSARKFLSFRTPFGPHKTKSSSRASIPSTSASSSTDTSHQITSCLAVVDDKVPLREAKVVLGVSMESFVEGMYIEEDDSDQDTFTADILLTPTPGVTDDALSRICSIAFVENEYGEDEVPSKSSGPYRDCCKKEETARISKRKQSLDSPTKRRRPKTREDLQRPSLKDFLTDNNNNTSPKDKSLETKSLHGGGGRRQSLARIKNNRRKDFSSLRDIISEYESIVGDNQ